MAGNFEASKPKFKDRWCLLAKSSLGLSIPEMVSKNQSKAMAHLLFPFIMREMHYAAQLHRNAQE